MKGGRSLILFTEQLVFVLDIARSLIGYLKGNILSAHRQIRNDTCKTRSGSPIVFLYIYIYIYVYNLHQSSSEKKFPCISRISWLRNYPLACKI